jgi:hypothetical protein
MRRVVLVISVALLLVTASRYSIQAAEQAAGRGWRSDRLGITV